MTVVMIGKPRVATWSHGTDEAGTPLVLLHGAGGTHLHWPPRLRRLPGRPVYALDWPGHGKTPGPGLETIADFAQLVTQWMDTLGIDRFVVAGHSLGSAVALDLALEYPQRVAALVVVAGGARLPVAPALLSALRDEPDAATEMIMRWSYGPGITAEQRTSFLTHLRKVEPKTLYRAYSACSTFDVTDRLPALDMPTLIVAGADDRMTPPAIAEELSAGTRGSTLHILPATGHMIPIEQPVALTSIVGDFLEAVGATGNSKG